MVQGLTVYSAAVHRWVGYWGCGFISLSGFCRPGDQYWCHTHVCMEILQPWIVQDHQGIPYGTENTCFIAGASFATLLLQVVRSQVLRHDGDAHTAEYLVRPRQQQKPHRSTHPPFIVSNWSASKPASIHTVWARETCRGKARHSGPGPAVATYCHVCLTTVASE